MDEKNENRAYTYRYAEFTDHTTGASLSYKKDGDLMFIGEPDEEIIRDFHLEKDKYDFYITTLARIGESDWRLKFVTPCSYGSGRGGAAIENSYIFEKKVEYVELDW